MISERFYANEMMKVNYFILHIVLVVIGKYSRWNESISVQFSSIFEVLTIIRVLNKFQVYLLNILLKIVIDCHVFVDIIKKNLYVRNIAK